MQTILLAHIDIC